jgi:MFS family permease
VPRAVPEVASKLEPPVESASRTVLVPSALLLVSMLNLTLIVAGLKELILDELGGSPRDASLFFSLEMLAYILFAPLWGLVSDRLGSRRALVAIGFLLSALFYAAFARVGDVDQLLALRFFQGVFTVMGWSLLMAMVLDHPDEKRRPRYMGIMGGALILGVSIGAPLGGYVSKAYGARAPLHLSALLFFVLAAATLLLRDRERLRSQPRLKEIFEALGRSPRLLLPCLFHLADRYTVGFVVILLPLFLATQGVDDPAVRGRYLGLFLLPFALLQVFTGRLVERFGAWRLLLGGSLGYGALLAVVGYADLYALGWVMALLGVLAAVMFPPAIALTAELSSVQTRGSAMGAFNLFGSLGFAVGPLVGVWLNERYGFGVAFASAGAIEAIVVIVALLVLSRSVAGDPVANRRSLSRQEGQ